MSQSGIQTNFTQLNNIFSLDHQTYQPAVANSGKHNKVTLPQQASTPATAALEGVIYTKDVSSVMQLLYRDQNSGTISQLLPANTWNSGASKGSLVLGTTVVNYGSITVAASSGTGVGSSTINYETSFSAAAYSIVITPAAQPGYPSDGVWVSSSTTTGATINQQSPGGNPARTFYYVAIGPAVAITP